MVPSVPCDVLAFHGVNRLDHEKQVAVVAHGEVDHREVVELVRDVLQLAVVVGTLLFLRVFS